MLVTLFGLAGAFVYGAADFLGGLASRRLSPFAVTGIAAGSGLLVLIAVYPFVGGAWSAEAVLWGSISGVSGAIGISLLYACLAIGPMSILSPLTAVISAIVPLSIGLARGAAFQPIGYAALALALIAVVLVAFVPGKDAVRPSLRGILMAIGSGATIGIFLVAIDAAPADSGSFPCSSTVPSTARSWAWSSWRRFSSHAGDRMRRPGPQPHPHGPARPASAPLWCSPSRAASPMRRRTA